MRPADTVARSRWAAIQLVRMLGYGGAVFGLVLLSRSVTTAPKVLGIAITLSALLMTAAVPLALARRWRTPRETGE